MTQSLRTGQRLDLSDPRWLDFCSRPGASIFHHPAWSELLARTYGYRPFILALTDAAGRIRAGLPLMEVKTLATRRWVSLPFTDHCAPLFVDKDDLPYLLEFVTTFFRDNGPASLELRTFVPDHSPLKPRVTHVLHTLPLALAYSQIETKIHAMHRRNAKTAQKRGVYLHSGTGKAEMDAFYALHLETRQRQGTPVQPRAFFDNLRTGLLEKGLGFISLAYYEQTCLAGAVFLHWGDVLTYKFGASTQSGLTLRPNDLIFMEAIRWGCENDYKRMDFGRTDIPNLGLREFKSRWGAEENPLAYSFLPAAPDGRESRVMSLAQAIIRRSPRFVCRLAGGLFYRYFG